MKNTLRIIFIIMFSLTSLSAAAQNAATQATTIDRVSNWNGGGNEQLWIELDESSTTNPADCDIVGWYILPASASDISRSMVLAAKSSNKEIILTIYGGGCERESPNSRPVIVNVTLP